MHRIATIVLLLAGCGTVASRPPAPTLPANVRVASYNIHAGHGADGRLDLVRTAGAVARLEADVVALQEVDQGTEGSGRVDQAARLGELLGMQHVFGSALPFQGGHYGLAILTRAAIRSSRVVRLPPGNEPRIALAVELDLADGTRVTVVNVHFDHVAADSFRVAQAREVAAFLDGLSGPWLLLGDFNDRPGSRTLALFRDRASEARKPTGANLTFPAGAPDREIDFIFGGPRAGWRFGRVRVAEESAASDHRPVVAELRWPAPSTSIPPRRSALTHAGGS